MRRSRCNFSTFLTDILPFVESDGARNLNAISHELGIPYQTLRERMRALGNCGLSVRPVIEADKIHLERVRASFRLSPLIGDNAQLFSRLNENAGLRYYSRGIISQEFDCEFWIPRGGTEELFRLFSMLEDHKVLSEFGLRKLLWKDFFMMKTRYFDYDRGEWDVDFSNLSGDPSLSPPVAQLSPEQFDYNDLLIMKSIEVNPWVKNTEIASEFQTPVSDVSYHLNKHVMKKKLISGFRLCWVGTRDAWLKHTIIAITLIFDSISDEMARHAMSVMTALPFAWNQARAEDGTYIVELLTPISQFIEMMRYISDNLRRVDLKPKILYVDPSCVSSFTIPYQMYNMEARDWSFDAENALESVLQVIKRGSSL